MSRTLSVEMSVGQLRTHPADPPHQQGTERLSSETAEQLERFAQASARVEDLTATLERATAELAKATEALQLHLNAAERSLARAHRRQAILTVVWTVLAVLAVEGLLHAGPSVLQWTARLYDGSPSAQRALPTVPSGTLQQEESQPDTQPLIFRQEPDLDGLSRALGPILRDARIDVAPTIPAVSDDEQALAIAAPVDEPQSAREGTTPPPVTP